ncbi:MAG: hypothetical protein BWX80_02614 [Candidatus Hydrogenedentes bacterium ADurb.Bin101]|nr:MAG: hypothetical protein BWX80_02614 [Candidatus Hydrogenedentes bacterium ADurb.Bin101]HOC68378.1 hypothetical protein [Candidatus Hydrogenedentota bacterium]
MEIRVTCPKCNESLNIDTYKVGMHTQCSHCGYMFRATADEVPVTSSPAASTIDPGTPGTSLFFDFATFKFMIMAHLVIVIYWMGTAACLLFGLITIMAYDNLGVGLAIIIAGPFILRIVCEYTILLFRMNATLTEILSKMQ